MKLTDREKDEIALAVMERVSEEFNDSEGIWGRLRFMFSRAAEMMRDRMKKDDESKPEEQR